MKINLETVLLSSHGNSFGRIRYFTAVNLEDVSSRSYADIKNKSSVTKSHFAIKHQWPLLIRLEMLGEKSESMPLSGIPS